MTKISRMSAFVLTLCSLGTAGEDTKWKFAGENQGVTFHLKIANQCKEGSKVTVRLHSDLDHPVTVSFRLNDSDWRKSFTQPLSAKAKEVAVNFTPSDEIVCHPFVDQVYVESQDELVTQGSGDADP